MTATDEIRLARAGFDALADHGVEAMLEYVHPEFVMETPAAIAIEPQVYHGHDGLRRYFDSFYEAMDEVTIEPVELEPLDAGRVLIHFKVRTRGKTSGIETEMEARAVAVLRDDLMVRLEFLLPEEPSPRPPG
jgi:ketosteroid isomerase-like protein